MPELHVDIEAIGRNSEAVTSLLRGRGLDLVAVTKGCLGEPRVAAAMLAGGAVALADTRDVHLRKLRAALRGAEIHRIDMPSPTRPFEPGDINYVSSEEGVEAVALLGSEGASGSGRLPRRVMVMVETGDEREGVPPDQLLDLATVIADDKRLALEGVATNYACFRGRPEGIRDSLELVAQAAITLRDAGLPVAHVSGGNSSLLRLIEDGGPLPSVLTELRCGEALLLGHDALHYRPLAGCRGDACVLRAEVVEEYTRHAPGGAFRRLLLGIGRQDLGLGSVKFAEPGLREIGRSSDYLVVETETSRPGGWAGEMVDMIPGYEALVAAWMSPYVERRFRGR